jgi:hypothetical protein
MKYFKNRPIGLWILAVLIPLFEISYYLRPIVSGYVSPYGSILTFSSWAVFVWFNIALSIIVIYAVTIGFYKRKNWARLYTIAYFCYSSIGNFYVIFIVRVWPYERYVWLVFYVIVIMYLMMSDVREYFAVKKLTL